MTKKFTVRNREFVGAVLLILVVIGSLSALLSVLMPYFSLAALKFTDGAPDEITLGDMIARCAFFLQPALPIGLFLGSISSLLYPHITKDSENRLFLWGWGGFLAILFGISIYKILQQ